MFADGVADEQAIKELSTLAMRCGGCGAKVGSSVLSRVIQRLPPQRRDDVVIGLDSPDDAAVYRVPEGMLLAQSVDYFRAFIDDPYVFGQIAANHALGDLFAMGAQAQSVLAIATVPYGRERVVEQTLYDVMSGALEVVSKSGGAGRRALQRRRRTGLRSDREWIHRAGPGVAQGRSAAR